MKNQIKINRRKKNSNMLQIKMYLVYSVRTRKNEAQDLKLLTIANNFLSMNLKQIKLILANSRVIKK